MFAWLFSQNVHLVTLGLLCIRVGIGVLIAIHGYGHLVAGRGTWQWLGSQLRHIGITFAPTIWGFFGSCIECFGGVLIMVGLATRLTALLLVMFFLVALLFHLKSKDPFKTYSHPLAFLIILVGLFIAGGGPYSLDYFFITR